ncbi:NAD(P)H-hydrate dehydratase [Maledivibacter halophilus]|uniref:Bifunctional NAD(P)H-hydrate repair enzyme n=1 Tax=Maledivibacter halophilus TaxID=36842 RepID=A0A1T5JFV3_9FIRM|nr:NAD(P)H-hydrate dehydratase [Maledivibacter halophilus]SKC50487.1 NAD(P)H-hydrate epimerase [Maledivibacter halophilus]
MKVVLNDEMRLIDKISMEKYGVPGVVLMENAGVSVVNEIIDNFNLDYKFTIVCGKGNNGGDGFVVARHLHNKGYKLNIFVLGDKKAIKGDALINYEILTKLGIGIKEIKNDDTLIQLKESIISYPIVIDALFGTGLSKEVQGISKKAINIINKYSKYTISIDIPSGVGGNDGKIFGTPVEANKTVTLCLPKCGNLVYPGAEYNGKLVIKDIGIPNEAIEDIELKNNLIDIDIVRQGLPSRKKDTHKGSYGKANIIAGSFGMTGAAILACKSALRTGTGLLKLYVGESINHIVKTGVPEVITVPLQEMRKGVIGINHIEKIIKDSKEANVLAIGPGCGNTSELAEIIKQVLVKVDIPIVIDADGLNVLSRDKEWFLEKKSKIVITPHIGEMSRLTNMDIEEIRYDLIKVAKDFAIKWGVIVVLKGASTIIASPEGEIFINVKGNPGMATAGSGDVLTGIITGLIAQGLEPLKAAITAVYVHGLTGDKVARDKGEYGLLAGDLVEYLPYTIKDIVEDNDSICKTF